MLGHPYASLFTFWATCGGGGLANTEKQKLQLMEFKIVLLVIQFGVTLDYHLMALKLIIFLTASQLYHATYSNAWLLLLLQLIYVWQNSNSILGRHFCIRILKINQDQPSPLLWPTVIWNFETDFWGHTTWPPPTKTDNWVWLALWSISLSYYLLLRVTSNLVSDESYWQRCCKSRWEVCDVAKHDNSWKRMYFERNLEGAYFLFF